MTGVNRRLGVLVRAAAATCRRSSTRLPRTAGLTPRLPSSSPTSRMPSALERARARTSLLCLIDHRGWPSRDDYDRALVRELQRARRRTRLPGRLHALVGAPLLDAYPSAILNIHPSLLPAFPGLDPQRQALDARREGERRHRAPGHGGTRRRADRRAAHRARPGRRYRRRWPLAYSHEEHRAYPEAVRMMSKGGRVEGRRWVAWPAPEPLAPSPARIRPFAAASRSTPPADNRSAPAHTRCRCRD